MTSAVPADPASNNTAGKTDVGASIQSIESQLAEVTKSIQSVEAEIKETSKGIRSATDVLVRQVFMDKETQLRDKAYKLRDKESKLRKVELALSRPKCNDARMAAFSMFALCCLIPLPACTCICSSSYCLLC